MYTTRELCWKQKMDGVYILKKIKEEFKAINKRVMAGISLGVSVIDIGLSGTLELWTSQCPVWLLCILAVLATLGAFVTIYSYMNEKDRRLRRCAGVLGGILGLCYTCGCRLRRDGTVLESVAGLPVFLISVVGFGILFAACCAFLLKKDVKKQPEQRKERKSGVLFLGYAGIILLCWIPIFLAYYPSVFAYDAEGQLYQVIAHDYSTHHPLLHTLFLGAFFRLGGMLGSYSAGMAIHSVVQMLLVAGAFGYALTVLYQKGVHRAWRIVLLLYFALFPVNSILAISTTKDVLFSALVLLYVLIMYRYFGKAADAGANSGKQEAVLVLIGGGMLLFRNNALYALAGSMLITFLLLMKGWPQSRKRRYLCITLASLALFAVATIGMKSFLHAEEGSPREMLSVPLQQLARTRVEHEEDMEPENREELEQYISSEWVGYYDPHLADPIKSRATFDNNPAGLIKEWIRLGVQFPQTYVDAFLDCSVGCWFLEDTSHSRIYGMGKESGFGYLSTDNRGMPAGCEIVPDSKLPGLRNFMEEIVSENRYQAIPLLSVIFAPAFYWWWLAFYVTSAIYRKRYEKLIPAVFLVVYYATLLLSPAVLVRYMYPLMVSVPVLFAMSTIEEEIQEL